MLRTPGSRLLCDIPVMAVRIIVEYLDFLDVMHLCHALRVPSTYAENVEGTHKLPCESPSPPPLSASHSPLPAG